MYSNIVSGFDQAGNVGTIQTLVTVPHDQGKGLGMAVAGVATQVGGGGLSGASSPFVIPPIEQAAPAGPLVLMGGATTRKRYAWPRLS